MRETGFFPGRVCERQILRTLSSCKSVRSVRIGICKSHVAIVTRRNLSHDRTDDGLIKQFEVEACCVGGSTFLQSDDVGVRMS